MGKATSRQTAWAVAIALVIAAGYLGWQVRHLGGFSYGYDEGVYAQSAWLVQAGHGLFSEVFSSQPPLFVASLAGVFALSGPSMPAARLLVILFSLLALGGVGLAAWKGNGLLAGIFAMALLAIDPNFILYSRVSESDVPSVSLAAAAMGLICVYQIRGRRLWLVGAAILFSLGLFAKLLVAPAALGLLAGILLHHFAGERRGDSGRAEKAAVDLGLLVVIVGLPWVGMIALYGINAPLDQLVTFHLRSQAVYPPNLLDNLREVVSFTSVDFGLLLLTIFGLGVLVVSRRLLGFLPIVVWLVATWLFLLDQAPLFSHHVVAVLPPLAALSGAGLSQGLAALGPIRTGYLKQAGAFALPALAAIAIVIYLAGLPRLVNFNLRSGIPDKPVEQEASAYLAAVTASNRYVISDEQMIPFAAGRMVPPNLTDTSTVRRDTGYLSPATLIQETEDSNAQAVVFWTGRFQSVPGYLDWVKNHYELARSFDESRQIYIKP